MPLSYPLNDLPYGQRVTVLDGNIYAVTSGPHFEVYNPTLNSWTEKAAPPYIGNLGACQGKIYLIGGDTYYQSCLTYDLANDSWAPIAAMPTGRYCIQPQEVEGKIYVIGGGRVIGLFMFQIFHANEAYDPTTNTWTKLASIPTAVFNYASAVVDGKIYIIGGIQNFTYIGGDTMQQTYTNLVQIYDPQTNQWTIGTSMSTPAGSLGGAATTGELAPKRIYVVGGNLNGRKGGTDYSTVNWTRIYDPETASWSEGASMPTARWGISLVNVNDRLYALGGGTADNSDPQLRVNEEYIPINYGFLTPSPTLQPTASPSIPEFPAWIILPFALLAVLTGALVKKQRRNK
ncbi:MAG: hypothetical protein NWF05_08640 [Candidatus Bathyarchaeota archaeon]|nr:hypothetical protein [Candidatus Bathyarchaeota archaeon]